MSIIVSDYLEVASGQKYSDVEVVSGGFVDVLEGGVVDGITVQPGAWVTVYEGGTASDIVENGGYIEGMGDATLTFCSNTITTLVVGPNEYASLHSGTNVGSTLVTGDPTGAGWMNVFPDAKLTSVTVASNGQLDTDGNMTSAVAVAGGYVNVRGQETDHLTVSSGGVGVVYNGGSADTTTVEDQGRFLVYGGVASNTDVRSGGSMIVQEIYDESVSSSIIGFASRTMVDGGTLRVVSNGSASGVILEGESYLYLLSGTVENVEIGYGSALVTGTSEGAGVMNGLLLAGGYVEIESTGIVTGATVAGGVTDVRSTGVLNGAIIGGDALVNIYGSASSIEQFDIDTVVNVYGTVTTAVLNGGDFLVSSGALVQGATVNAGVAIFPEAESLLSATVIHGGTVTVYGIAGDTLVTDGGEFNLVDGGYAYDVFVTQGSVAIDGCSAENVVLGVDPDPNAVVSDPADPVDATLTLLNDGYLENLTVKHQGAAYLNDCTVTGATTTDYDAFIYVEEGAALDGVTVDCGTVYVNGGFLSGITLNGKSQIPFGAMLPPIYPADAELVVAGGTATDVVLNSASATVGAGVVKNAKLNDVARMTITDGGVLTGEVSIYRDRNTRIDVSSGGVIDFDLTGATAGAEALMTNLVRVFGAPTYTMEVSTEQAMGVYRLTDCAGAFAGTITVTDDTGVSLGTLSLTDPIQVGNNYYSLRMNYGALEFCITATAPEAPQAAVYVDTAWASLADGTVVEVTGGTAIVGLTAFANGDEAMNHVAPDGVLTVVGGTVSFQYDVYRDTVAAEGVVISDTTVAHGGSLTLLEGATGIDLTVDEEAALIAAAGSTLTGECWWDDSSDIVIDGVVDFDVSGSTGGNDLPYYNRLSLIDGGTPTYSVTIREGQTYGTYLLAYYPPTGDITVALQLADGTVIDYFEPDMPIVYGEDAYSLVFESAGGASWLDLVVEEFVPTSEITYVSSEWAQYPKYTVVPVTGGTAIVGVDAFSNPDRAALYTIEGGTVFVEGGSNEFSKQLRRNVLVRDGAVLNDPSVAEGATLTAEDGAVVTNPVITPGAVFTVEDATILLNGGDAIIEAGGDNSTLVPTAAFLEGSTVSIADGATLSFDITGPNALSAVLLNGLAFASGDPGLTLTVADEQERGLYTLMTEAPSFNESITILNQNGAAVGTLEPDGFLRYGNSKYYIKTSDENTTVSILADAPDPVNCDIDGNYVSEVMFVWKENNQIGYWMNGQADWQSSLSSHPDDVTNLGCHDMDGDGRADAVMVTQGIGQNEDYEEVEGIFVGYYPGGDDQPDGSTWVTLGFMENTEGFAWTNAIGNLTGQGNSVVWFAAEQGILGAWLDGTDEWVMITNAFSGDRWTLAGCGDFNGDGVDSILMCHNGYQYYYADLDGTFGQLSTDNTIWDSCEVRAIGDFDASGIDDIVLYEEGTGSMYMLYDANPDQYASVGQLDAKEWDFVGCGDYNGDQYADLLVRQYANGSSAVGYFAGGLTFSDFVEIGCGIDSSWSVIA